MTTLADLNKSILQLTPEEGFQLIKDVRERRRTVVKKTITVTKKQQKKPIPSIEVLFAGMTQENKDKMIKKMEEDLK